MHVASTRVIGTAPSVVEYAAAKETRRKHFLSSIFQFRVINKGNKPKSGLPLHAPPNSTLRGRSARKHKERCRVRKCRCAMKTLLLIGRRSGYRHQYYHRDCRFEKRKRHLIKIDLDGLTRITVRATLGVSYVTGTVSRRKSPNRHYDEASTVSARPL